ncbi:MAG: zinc ribbon domain-containing protein [Deltaproteobacteria bacterium]|nr:zinc ribbon domain-containing protein [Deltaproteobacteria bacterium]
MRCAKCQAENLADSLFCTECGAKMEVPCAACGGTNPATAKFCRRCGAALVASQQSTLDSSGRRPGSAPAAGRPGAPASYTPKHLADKILQSKSAIEGERKQVTVLFADVKGSMELAEQLDPEQWHAILDRFFAILTDGVHRFEGTVNQYTGDGIMALFGAPITHEYHAQRACYAALHLRDALKAYADELRRTAGVSLSTRIGINSGEVVVGRIGDDLRMDYTAQGHTVGLAQRMEARAAADSTYLTAHTARLVEGYFQLRDLARELPSRVPSRLDAQGVLSADTAAAARAGGDRRDARRPPGVRPFGGGPVGVCAPAHRRQPVLHRRGRAVAARERPLDGRPRRLSPRRRGWRGGDSRHGAKRASGAHRPPRRRREARAADRVGDRQGVLRGDSGRGGRGGRGRSAVFAQARRGAQYVAGRRVRLRDGALSGGRVRLQASADAGSCLPLTARRAPGAGARRGGACHGAAARRQAG